MEVRAWGFYSEPPFPAEEGGHALVVVIRLRDLDLENIHG